MSLSQRAGLMVRASLNNLLERAENPDRMLRLYRRELESVIDEIEGQRRDIRREIQRLEAAPASAEIVQEIQALERREYELAETAATLAGRLGQVKGRLLVRRQQESPDKPGQPGTDPLPDTRAFDQAVGRFQQSALEAERRLLELEGA